MKLHQMAALSYDGMERTLYGEPDPMALLMMPRHEDSSIGPHVHAGSREEADKWEREGGYRGSKYGDGVGYWKPVHGDDTGGGDDIYRRERDRVSGRENNPTVKNQSGNNDGSSQQQGNSGGYDYDRETSYEERAQRRRTIESAAAVDDGQVKGFFGDADEAYGAVEDVWELGDQDPADAGMGMESESESESAIAEQVQQQRIVAERAKREEGREERERDRMLEALLNAEVAQQLTPEELELLYQQMEGLQATGVTGQGLREALGQSEAVAGLNEEQRESLLQDIIQFQGGALDDPMDGGGIGMSVTPLGGRIDGGDNPLMDDPFGEGEPAMMVSPDEERADGDDALAALGAETESAEPRELTAQEREDVAAEMAEMLAGADIERGDGERTAGVDRERAMAVMDEMEGLEGVSEEERREMVDSVLGQQFAVNAAADADTGGDAAPDAALAPESPADAPAEEPEPAPAAVVAPEGVPSHDWMQEHLEKMQSGDLSEEETASVNEALERYNAEYGIDAVGMDASTEEIIERITDTNAELDEHDVVALQQMMAGSVGERVVVVNGEETTIRDYLAGAIPGIERGIATEAAVGEIGEVMVDGVDEQELERLREMAADPATADLTIMAGEPPEETRLGDYLGGVIPDAERGIATQAAVGEIGEVMADGVDEQELERLREMAADPATADLTIMAGEPPEETRLGDYLGGVIPDAERGIATQAAVGEIGEVMADGVDEQELERLREMAADPATADLTIMAGEPPEETRLGDYLGGVIPDAERGIATQAAVGEIGEVMADGVDEQELERLREMAADPATADLTIMAGEPPEETRLGDYLGGVIPDAERGIATQAAVGEIGEVMADGVDEQELERLREMAADPATADLTIMAGEPPEETRLGDYLGGVIPDAERGIATQAAVGEIGEVMADGVDEQELERLREMAADPATADLTIMAGEPPEETRLGDYLGGVIPDAERGIATQAAVGEIGEVMADGVDEQELERLREMAADPATADLTIMAGQPPEETRLGDYLGGVIGNTERGIATQAAVGEIGEVMADGVDEQELERLREMAADPATADLTIMAGQPPTETTIGDYLGDLLPNVQGQLDWQATNEALGDITEIRSELDAGDIAELQAIADDPARADLVIQVPARGEDGQPIQATDENGLPLKNEKGEPVYEMVDTTIGEHIRGDLLPGMQSRVRSELGVVPDGYSGVRGLLTEAQPWQPANGSYTASYTMRDEDDEYDIDVTIDPSDGLTGEEKRALRSRERALIRQLEQTPVKRDWESDDRFSSRLEQWERGKQANIDELNYIKGLRETHNFTAQNDHDNRLLYDMKDLVTNWARPDKMTRAGMKDSRFTGEDGYFNNQGISPSDLEAIDRRIEAMSRSGESPELLAEMQSFRAQIDADELRDAYDVFERKKGVRQKRRLRENNESNQARYELREAGFDTDGLSIAEALAANNARLDLVSRGVDTSGMSGQDLLVAESPPATPAASPLAGVGAGTVINPGMVQAMGLDPSLSGMTVVETEDGGVGLVQKEGGFSGRPDAPTPAGFIPDEPLAGLEGEEVGDLSVAATESKVVTAWQAEQLGDPSLEGKIRVVGSDGKEMLWDASFVAEADQYGVTPEALYAGYQESNADENELDNQAVSYSPEALRVSQETGETPSEVQARWDADAANADDDMAPYYEGTKFTGLEIQQQEEQWAGIAATMGMSVADAKALHSGDPAAFDQTYKDAQRNNIIRAFVEDSGIGAEVEGMTTDEIWAQYGDQASAAYNIDDGINLRAEVTASGGSVDVAYGPSQAEGGFQSIHNAAVQQYNEDYRGGITDVDSLKSSSVIDKLNWSLGAKTANVMSFAGNEAQMTADNMRENPEYDALKQADDEHRTSTVLPNGRTIAEQFIFDTEKALKDAQKFPGQSWVDMGVGKQAALNKLMTHPNSPGGAAITAEELDAMAAAQRATTVEAVITAVSAVPTASAVVTGLKGGAKVVTGALAKKGVTVTTSQGTKTIAGVGGRVGLRESFKQNVGTVTEALKSAGWNIPQEIVEEYLEDLAIDMAGSQYNPDTDSFEMTEAAWESLQSDPVRKVATGVLFGTLETFGRNQTIFGSGSGSGSSSSADVVQPVYVGEAEFVMPGDPDYVGPVAGSVAAGDSVAAGADTSPAAPVSVAPTPSPSPAAPVSVETTPTTVEESSMLPAVVESESVSPGVAESAAPTPSPDVVVVTPAESTAAMAETVASTPVQAVSQTGGNAVTPAFAETVSPTPGEAASPTLIETVSASPTTPTQGNGATITPSASPTTPTQGNGATITPSASPTTPTPTQGDGTTPTTGGPTVPVEPTPTSPGTGPTGGTIPVEPTPTSPGTGPTGGTIPVEPTPTSPGTGPTGGTIPVEPTPTSPGTGPTGGTIPVEPTPTPTPTQGDGTGTTPGGPTIPVGPSAPTGGTSGPDAPGGTPGGGTVPGEPVPPPGTGEGDDVIIEKGGEGEGEGDGRGRGQGFDPAGGRGMSMARGDGRGRGGRGRGIGLPFGGAPPVLPRGGFGRGAGGAFLREGNPRVVQWRQRTRVVADLETGEFTEQAITPPVGVIITMKDKTAPEPAIRYADTMELTPTETWVEVQPRATGKTGQLADSDIAADWEGGQMAQGSNPRVVTWDQDTLVTHDLDAGVVTEQALGEPLAVQVLSSGSSAPAGDRRKVDVMEIKPSASGVSIRPNPNPVTTRERRLGKGKRKQQTRKATAGRVAAARRK